MADAEQLFRDNTGIVGHLTRRPRFRHLDAVARLDLEQNCLIALWLAARQYDPGRGAFAPYAFAAVRHSIGAFLRDRRRIPRTLSLDLERGPDGRRLRDLVPDRPGPDAGDQIDAAEAVAALSPRRQVVVRATFLEGKTCDQVGHELGRTGQAVADLRAKAVEDLRALLTG
jgi:RNA polymerase sigma factor (sigma-70 family)